MTNILNRAWRPNRWYVGVAVQTFLLMAFALTLGACASSPEDVEPEVVVTAVVPADEPATAMAVTPTAAPAEETPAEPSSAEAADQPGEASAPQAGSVQIAVNAHFKPFLFVDENGNLAGFDFELMNELSRVGNFEVAYTDRPFDDLLQEVAAGEYDAGISAITINEQRQELVDFTNPYFDSTQASLSFYKSGLGLGVRNDNTTIMGKHDLTEGVIVGIKRGTTAQEFASSLQGVRHVRFDESNEVIAGLVDGAVDAVIMDLAVIADYARNNPGQVKLVGGPLTEETYGIAVNKERTELLELLNDSLAEIREDGTYDQVFNSWFGSP